MPGRRFFLDRYSELGHTLTGKEATRKSLRVNWLKAPEDIIERLRTLGVELSRIDFLKDGYYIEKTDFSLGASFEYLLGYYSLQEAASQFAVEVMDPKSGEAIMDMFAAPGVKTTQIADRMGNTGVLVAVDINRKRLYALENSLERCGVENCVVYWSNALNLDLEGLQFDGLLLDVPCSGNYVTDKEWFSKRRIEDIEKNAERHRLFLESGLNFLRKGGELVYATCSLEPEENELTIQWLLDNHPVELEKIEGPGSPGLVEVFGETLSPEISKCRRFWPDETGTQGFFVARVRKK